MNIPNKIRYVSASKPGGQEAFEIKECSIPSCGKDEVLTKITGGGSYANGEFGAYRKDIYLSRL